MSKKENSAGTFFCRALFCVLALLCSTGIARAQTNSPSTLIEAAGQVEYLTHTKTNWESASVGLMLQPGDRLRTQAQSRAAVQLSDRSVVRLDELTIMEILPPRNTEKKRFSLLRGALYFFNREKPADVEFDTPLAAGAIRGTEFLLEVQDSSVVHLALIDGQVSLKSASGEITMRRGEDLLLESGKPPRKTALLNANRNIQWALYYPAVIAPADLQLTADESAAVAAVLKEYSAGDLVGALAAWPQNENPTSSGLRILRAQLELAVGRVNDAEQLINGTAADGPGSALHELIAVVRDEKMGNASPHGASALLARSYAQQAASDLHGARASAQEAVRLAPDFGFAHARLGDLEFAFGNRRAALTELYRSLQLSPRLAAAHTLKGFVLLEQGDVNFALSAFDVARGLDSALGSAWLGRGLCLLQLRHFLEARSAFQAAAALEPQRGLFRSYLGKTASELGDDRGAEKEFRLAKELDPNDPTAWLYSALHLWQENQLNAAIRDLETSIDKNNNRAVFRSHELLDADKSVRSADLAAIYNDAGLPDVSRHLAARSVSDSYANFSGHLFLANAYQAEESANHFDLRLETARQSELLVANLLAPPGAGNLSQVLSQQDRLRYFDSKPIGASTLTQYDSRGDRSETATVFGSTGGLSYAFDTVYQSLNGQRINSDSEQRDFILTMKQRVTPDDEAYFQIGDFHSASGDISSLYDPTTATPGLRTNEKQQPDIYAGWHHAWAPGVHTLLLASRLDDTFFLHDPMSDQIFLVQSNGVTTGVQQPPLGPAFTNDLFSRFVLYSLELQQIFETEHHSFIFGGRWQSGQENTRATLTRDVSGTISDQIGSANFSRQSVYGYYTWRPTDRLSLIGGATYDHLQFPQNTDFVPLSLTEMSRDKISPKAGILFTPWNRGLLRASYTRSMGGMFFDNSVRLEPTQVGGFNQAFRSLIPESAEGLLSGANFETASVGFDQSFANGTFLGVEAEWLRSDGVRSVGVLTNTFFLPIPDSADSTHQSLNFRERDFSAYASQLLGDWFSLGGRYRLSDARLEGMFPDLPSSASGIGQIQENKRGLLHQMSVALNFNHPSGVFAQWESTWYHQQSSGYATILAAEDFWQHNVQVGYRFSHRRAEVRAGILNLTDTDYRLNPLNFLPELQRKRTFAASLRVNF